MWLFLSHHAATPVRIRHRVRDLVCFEAGPISTAAAPSRRIAGTATTNSGQAAPHPAADQSASPAGFAIISIAAAGSAVAAE
ncbi:hypothetical protein [Nocardia beijingensis]